MTDGKDFKRLVRERMAQTGEPYTAARANFQIKARSKAAKGSQLPVKGAVASFRQSVFIRTGIERFPSHLEDTYGFRVSRMTELDAGVFRIDRQEGPSWVARVLPKGRPLDAVEGDAEILKFLESVGFPAERCGHHQPVSIFEGQGVLVTGFVQGQTLRSDLSGDLLHLLGDLLGGLHSLNADSGAMAREAGSWHILSMTGGSRQQDSINLMGLLADAETVVTKDDVALFDALREEVAGIDDCSDQPHALIHPDFVGANAIASGRGPVVVDWIGAGRGPRISSLANLLAAPAGLAWQEYSGHHSTQDPRLIDAVIAGYRRHVQLQGDEIARLAKVLPVFPLILDCWHFLFEQVPLPRIVDRVSTRRELAKTATQRVIDAFETDLDVLAAWSKDGSPRPQVEGQGTLF